MWLVGARLVGTGSDSTEVARRHAVWVFPCMFLLHAIFVRAIAPELQQANLIAAVVAAAGGLAFRWLQRATLVIGAMFVFGLFSFVYMFGIAAPLAYLVLIDHRDWIPAAATASVLVLGACLVWRVHVSLAREWSQPLDETPGVQIATADWILWREFGREMPVLNLVAVGLGLAFVPAVALTRGTPYAPMLVLLIGPMFLALMLVDAVACQLSFYIAVRHWEAARGIRLRFPKLTAHRARERRKSIKKRSR